MNRLFEIHPWKLTTQTLPHEIRLLESLTSIGNGHMGMRGNFEEGFSGDSLGGSYIAGVWFPDRTKVGWWKNGYPEYFGKAINAVDYSSIHLQINDIPVDLQQIPFRDFFLELDMQNGLLHREYTCTCGDAEIRLSFRRFLSIHTPELAFFSLNLQMLTGKADIILSAGLNGDVYNEDSNYGESFWQTEGVCAEPVLAVQNRTRPNDFGTERFTVTAAMQNRLSVYAKKNLSQLPSAMWEAFCFSLGEGQSAQFEKTVAIITDRDIPAAKHFSRVRTLLDTASNAGFDAHLQDQAVLWKQRWDKADVIIDGDDQAQQGIRFNLFQLFCTYYGEDERLNIGPKGFTGEKYGGATYWDTEAYLLPMYLCVADQHVSRALLDYRHRQLPGALHNARQQGLQGALYPMVTFNGIECHNEWEITFEEIHRNGAIAHAIYTYTRYTGDRSYVLTTGIDVLVEIARFWASRVHYSKRKGLFMIHGVTGPNEYENNVNNNWYTNYTAKWDLLYTLSWLDQLSPDKYRELNLSPAESDRWQNIAKNMYLPQDKDLGIFVQHDTFLDKELIPASQLSPKDRPINQHWSWDKILRSCFIKQADVLQGIYLYNDRFTLEEKKRNFSFYEPFTVHESSLSASVHAILAAELGLEDRAVELYSRTARLDLDNYNNDTEDGLHITSMSGGWLAIVQGFAGMRVKDDALHFNPFCPSGWASYTFTINFRGRRLHLKTTQEETILTLLSGSPIELFIHGKKYFVEHDIAVSLYTSIQFSK